MCWMLHSKLQVNRQLEASSRLTFLQIQTLVTQEDGAAAPQDSADLERTCGMCKVNLTQFWTKSSGCR